MVASTVLVRTRARARSLGRLAWRRVAALCFITGRLGSAVKEPSRSDPRDNSLCESPARERASIEMLDEVLKTWPSNSPTMFQGLPICDPGSSSRSCSQAAAACESETAGTLFYADRRWTRLVQTYRPTQVDLGKGKRQPGRPAQAGSIRTTPHAPALRRQAREGEVLTGALHRPGGAAFALRAIPQIAPEDFA